MDLIPFEFRYNQAIKKVDLQPLKSSNIESYGYLKEEKLFIIKFKNGGHYLYIDVPEELEGQFRVATSLGRFFYQNIKGKYPGMRLNLNIEVK